MRPIARVALAILLGLLVVGCDTSSSPSSGSPPERLFGELVNADASAQTVAFRLGEFFEGDQAVIEAQRDGDTAVNNFYVRMGTKVSTFPLAADATVSVVGHDTEGHQVASPITAQSFYDPAARAESHLYWFEVADGRVTTIEVFVTP